MQKHSLEYGRSIRWIMAKAAQKVRMRLSYLYIHTYICIYICIFILMDVSIDISMDASIDICMGISISVKHTSHQSMKEV